MALDCAAPLDTPTAPLVMTISLEVPLKGRISGRRHFVGRTQIGMTTYHGVPLRLSGPYEVAEWFSESGGPRSWWLYLAFNVSEFRGPRGHLIQLAQAVPMLLRSSGTLIIAPIWRWIKQPYRGYKMMGVPYSQLRNINGHPW